MMELVRGSMDRVPVALVGLAKNAMNVPVKMECGDQIVTKFVSAMPKTQKCVILGQESASAKQDGTAISVLDRVPCTCTGKAAKIVVIVKTTLNVHL